MVCQTPSQFKLKVHRRVLDRLGPRDGQLLRQIGREPADFVANPGFAAADAEARIMTPVQADGGRPIQRFIQAAADPIGDLEDLDIPTGAVLNAAQERALFTQYNYCRYRATRALVLDFVLMGLRSPCGGMVYSRQL